RRADGRADRRADGCGAHRAGERGGCDRGAVRTDVRRPAADDGCCHARRDRLCRAAAPRWGGARPLPPPDGTERLIVEGSWTVMRGLGVNFQSSYGEEFTPSDPPAGRTVGRALTARAVGGVGSLINGCRRRYRRRDETTDPADGSVGVGGTGRLLGPRGRDAPGGRRRPGGRAHRRGTARAA